MARLLSALCGVSFLLATMQAQAGQVGELHRVVFDDKAGLRDAEHRSDLRITVWYPAAPDSVETRLLVGPPGNPVFDIGSVAQDAAFAAGQEGSQKQGDQNGGGQNGGGQGGRRSGGEQGARPVILLSHGFGGSARIMGWFGIAMARDGYIVIAVDHPGNNSLDKMTVAGTVLWWDRAQDLRIVLGAMARDPVIGPHLDMTRIGAAGFSAGGFTALLLAGARVEQARLVQFCAANPADGICRPQREFAVSFEDATRAFEAPEMAAEASHAGDDYAIPGLRAAFVMAPGLVQALAPPSLADLHTPVRIILGDADVVAPPATNGRVAAAAIPGAELDVLPSVGHYDFLASCTPAGQATVPLCKVGVPQPQTHDRAIAAAREFFAAKLDMPQAAESRGNQAH